MCFFKFSVGLKKWLTKSGPTSPQYPLQIDALKDSCINWGSRRLYQISRLIIKHILYFYTPWMEFFISCCYTYFLDSRWTIPSTFTKLTTFFMRQFSPRAAALVHPMPPRSQTHDQSKFSSSKSVPNLKQPVRQEAEQSKSTSRVCINMYV